MGQSPPLPLSFAESVPWSKSQIDKLGERLRASDEPTVGDLDSLDEVRALYVAPMRLVSERLIAEGFSPTTRPEKTWQSTVEKLKRETSTRLSQIRDIAGARVVIDGGRRMQDEAVHLIGQLFPEHKKIDRRAEPKFGYRAVHLEVRIDNFFVEIQVRTSLQDQWAQINEKLADMFGRGIRYGEAPDDWYQRLGPEADPMSIIELVQRTSNQIANLEEVELDAEEIEVTEADSRHFPGLELQEIGNAAEQEFQGERIPNSKALLSRHLAQLRLRLETIERLRVAAEKRLLQER